MYVTANAPATGVTSTPPSTTANALLALAPNFPSPLDELLLLLQAWLASTAKAAPSANNRLILFTEVSIGRGP
jgi:hypothetical protein